MVNQYRIILVFALAILSQIYASDFTQKDNLIYAKTENYIDKHLNIDKFLVRSIVKVESGFHKFAVNLYVKNQKAVIEFLREKHINFAKKSKSRISVFPQSKAKANIFYTTVIEDKDFKKYHILDYDLGLMQINKSNFKAYALDKSFYLDYVNNMIVGSKILRECFDWSKKKLKGHRQDVVVAFAIECYNKGTRVNFIDSQHYGYYSSVLRTYITLKGGLK